MLLRQLALQPADGLVELLVLHFLIQNLVVLGLFDLLDLLHQLSDHSDHLIVGWVAHVRDPTILFARLE